MPNVTRSASESVCLPIWLVELILRATRPSKISKHPPININIALRFKYPRDVMAIDNIPKVRLNSVAIKGNSFLFNSMFLFCVSISIYFDRKIINNIYKKDIENNVYFLFG